MLSICMPTYNRSALLARHLAELDQPGLFPFPFEIVAADNCSTDDTQAVLQAIRPQSYQLRIVRNPRNTGVIPNLLNSLRHAAGEFCVYVADDDRLDVPNLIRAVERMIAMPDAVATYSGSTHRDLATGEFKEEVARLPDGIYPRERGGELIDAMLRNYLFPEFALYRVSVLARVLFPGVTLFWPFPLIDRLLAQGSVLTTASPFYYVVDRHPGETEARGSAGSGLEQRVWASITGGMDFLAAKYLPETAPSDREILKTAYFAYMENQSFFSSVHRRRYAEAFEIAAILDAKGLLLTHHTDAEWANFLIHAALESAQRMFEIMGGVDALTCIGFDPAFYAELAQILEQTAGEHRLPVTSASLLAASSDLQHSAVLTATNVQRDVLLAKGHPIGQILSLEDLRQVFALTLRR